LARRRAVWPERSERLAQVEAHLRTPETRLWVAIAGETMVGMASAQPLRADDGAGPVIPGGWFLNLLFVLPERWGEGIGGKLLDAVLAEARKRECSRIQLWTEEDNERSHRLYRGRGFAPTGRLVGDAGEWALEL